MQTKELDTQPAYNGWWAARDARMRSYACESTYSEEQKLKASRVKGALDLVYSAREIHVNYREKFISIKVEKPVVRDRKNLKLLEEDWTQDGITRRDTAQGIIYRIPRL